MDTLSQIAGIPSYVQIREAVREEIVRGHFVPGQQIPPEEKLAEHYGVSRMTLRHSLMQLVQEGVLYRRRGVGTFVAPIIERDFSHLFSSFEQLLARGLVPTARVLQQSAVAAEPRVSKSLGIAVGAMVIRLKRLRLGSGQPTQIIDSRFPQALVPQLLEADMEANPSLSRLMESWGFQYARAVQHLEVHRATMEQAKLLRIEPGSPIVYNERVNFTSEGQPVEYVESYTRADQWRATMVLTR